MNNHLVQVYNNKNDKLRGSHCVHIRQQVSHPFK